MSDNFSSHDFFNAWNECLVPSLYHAFNPFDGTPLHNAFSTLVNSEEWKETLQAIDEALQAAGALITELLTFELNFLCSYDGTNDPGSPTPEHAKLEKIKIILNSLNYVLDTLDFKHKKLLHILIELIGLAQ